MKGRFVCVILLSVVSFPALADRWIPYTDGRVGGCFQNRVGNLYGCTPQPSKQVEAREPQVIYRDRADPRVDQLQSENRALRQELTRQQEIEREEAAAQARQAQALAEHRRQAARREQAVRNARIEQEWRQSRTDCNTQEYLQGLERRGLQPHPAVHGICVPIGYKRGSGVISATECPPCR